MKLAAALFAGMTLLTTTSYAADPTDNKSAQASTTFAADLYKQLAAVEKGNLFLSPSSIRTALAMTYAGAAGNTADQMAKTLHFDLPADKLHPAMAALIEKLNSPKMLNDYAEINGKVESRKVPAYQLTVCNALWGQKGYPFRKEFLDLTQKSYSAGLSELDFQQPEAARNTINTWVSDKTKKKIENLIGPGVLTDATRLVLTNAVYFKSDWEIKFKKSATADAPFHLSEAKNVTVKMMHQTERHGYFENDDLQAVSLSYKGGDLSMLVIVPKKIDGLAKIEKQLSGDQLEQWTQGLKHTRVKLSMPRWTFTSEFRPDAQLKALGMTDAFDPAKADFSNMVSHEPLFISAILHKAFVAVDEDGTEAAAATAVIMEGQAAMRPEDPKIVTVDRPFLFAIRHNPTSEILFLGRVTDPSPTK